MYLSYSGFKKHKECPAAYAHAYVFKTALSEDDNRVNMLYGSTIGVLIEDFYNEKLWKRRDVEEVLLSRVEATLEKVKAKEIQTGQKSGRKVVFNWKKHKEFKSDLDLTQALQGTVPKALETIRVHRLLGVDAAAEVKLDHDIKGHRFAGRADAKLTRPAPHSDRIIYDGKGSLYRDQYVDVRQLHWYALLDWAKNGQLPDRVAFVFWRFPSDEAIDWHPVTKEAVEELREEVLASISEIESATRKRHLRAFEARPSESKCKLCSFSFACPEGKVILSEDRPTFSDDAGVEGVTMGVNEDLRSG